MSITGPRPWMVTSVTLWSAAGSTRGTLMVSTPFSCLALTPFADAPRGSFRERENFPYLRSDALSALHDQLQAAASGLHSALAVDVLVGVLVLVLRLALARDGQHAAAAAVVGDLDRYLLLLHARTVRANGDA